MLPTRRGLLSKRVQRLRQPSRNSSGMLTLTARRIDQADIDAVVTDEFIASGFALEGWTAENCSNDGPNEDAEEALSHPGAVAEAIDQLILQAAEEFGVDYREEDYEILTAVVAGDCAVI